MALSLALTAIVLLFSPLIAAAQISYTPLAPIPGVSAGGIFSYLGDMIRIVIGVAGLLAVIKIVSCGFKLVTSPSPTTRSEAKKCLVLAVTGLILAMSAFLILQTINADLLRSTSLAGVSAPSGGGPVAGGPTGTTTYWYFDYINTNTGVHTVAGPFVDTTACNANRPADTAIQTTTACYTGTGPTGGTPGGMCPIGSTCAWGSLPGLGSVCAQYKACPPTTGYTRVEGDANPTTGPCSLSPGPATSVCCVYTPITCRGCVDVPVPPGRPGQRLKSSLSSRLLSLSQLVTKPIVVTSAYNPAGIAHCSNAQMEGGSADIDFTTGGETVADIRNVIDRGANQGLRIVYETTDSTMYNALIAAGVSPSNVMLFSGHITGSHFSVYED